MFKAVFQFIFGVGIALFVLFILFLGFVFIVNTNGHRQQELNSILPEKPTTSKINTFDADKYIAENKMVTVYVIHGSLGFADTQYLTLEKCQEETDIYGGRCVKVLVLE